MGVGADSTQKAFASTDITAFFKRPSTKIHRDMCDYDSKENTNHVIIAVDPAGGGSSAFAISSVCQLSTGTLLVSSKLLLR